MQKLGFWTAPVLIINCHFGSDSRESNMTRLPQPKAPMEDIRASALKGRKPLKAPVSLDPWWEGRKELERPERKMFGARSLE